MTDRIYYLEEPLSESDTAFVSKHVFAGRIPTQVRIPHVLPVLETGALSQDAHQKHEKLLRKNLRGVGIGADRNKQVALVAPRNMYWNAAISTAVEAETGVYPWLVQTSDQLRAIGNPGETRILDMEGLFGRKP